MQEVDHIEPTTEKLLWEAPELTSSDISKVTQNNLAAGSDGPSGS